MNSRGDNNTIRDDSSRLGGGKTNAFGTSGQGGNVHRLPPGTGPGTSGKPATDADRSAMSGRNSSGLGQSGTGTRTGGLTSSQRTGGERTSLFIQTHVEMLFQEFRTRAQLLGSLALRPVSPEELVSVPVIVAWASAPGISAAQVIIPKLLKRFVHNWCRSH